MIPSSKFSTVHSAVCDATSASSSRKANKKTTSERKPAESILYSGSCQTFSSGTDEVPKVPDGEPSVFRSDGKTVHMLNVQEPVKGTGVKKKKKKRRFGKRSSNSAETSSQSCPEATNLCWTTEPPPLQIDEEASNSPTYDGSKSHFSTAPSGLSLKDEKPFQTTDAQCDRNRNGLKEAAGESTRVDESRSRVIFDFTGFVPEEPLEILVFGSLAVRMHSNPGKKICPSSDLNNFREENKAVGEVSKLGAKSGKVSSGLSEVSVATANNATTEEGQKQSSDDVFHMRGVLHNLRLSGKENSGLTWQRVQDVKTVATGASSMKGYPRAQRQKVVACKEAQLSGAFKVLGLPQKTSHHKLGQPHCFEENRERRSSGRLDHSPKWVNVQQSREELSLSKLSFCRPQSQEAAVRKGNHSEGGPTHEWGKSTVGSASTRPSLTIPTHLPVREVKVIHSHVQNNNKYSTFTEKSVPVGLVGTRKEFPRGFCMSGEAEESSVRITSQAAFQILSASYKSQLASEQAELAGGGPIAEFEKLMAAVSPVIIPSVDLAGHPDASLAHVWSWYEEPGAYGLGVRAEPSQNSKNWGSGGFPFHAYFVPSLSAVQLFSHPRDNNVGVKKTQEGRRWPDSSYAEDTLPSCCEVEAPDDSVLLFEYFEHERPDQRKPFCAKVKELAEGGVPNYQTYGGPSKLEHMSLRDLHPASWYSVAWYPIYRIPQGAFRASFLTYHSLGHAAQRRRTPPGGSPVGGGGGGDGCIVSPPLGMESYNAQGEGWLEPREGAASGALEGRLGAMGRAASVFSRGTVRRGPAQVRNNHPDYEFFLSRK